MFGRRSADPVGDLMLTYQQKFYEADRRAAGLYVAIQRYLDDDLDLGGLRIEVEAGRGGVVYIPKRFRTPNTAKGGID